MSEKRIPNSFSQKKTYIIFSRGRNDVNFYIVPRFLVLIFDEKKIMETFLNTNKSILSNVIIDNDDLIIINNNAALKQYIDRCIDPFFEPLILFDNCVFEMTFSFHQFFEILKEIEVDVNEVIFQNCVFTERLDIFNTQFDLNLIFSNVEVKSDITLKNIHFEKKVKLSMVKVAGDIFLENCNFKKQAHFSCMEVSGIITLHSSFMEELIFLALAKVEYLGLIDVNINCCKIKKISALKMILNNAKIEDFFTVENSKINVLEIRNVHINNKPLQIEKTNIINGDRETFRFLKAEAIKAQKIILGRHYEAREIEEFRKENCHWKNLSTYILLTLSKWSNCISDNLILALFCLLISFLFFFSLFVCFRDGWGDHFIWTDPKYIKEAICYLCPLNDFSKVIQNNNLTTIIFYGLVYIVPSYFVYQIKKAFDKFKK